MKRKHDRSTGCYGGEKRPKKENANINAMYCNRRTRDKDRLTRWIEDVKKIDDPRIRLATIENKKTSIEQKWSTYYISANPRLKNSSPSVAWYDLWRDMGAIIAEAESEILETEIAAHQHEGLDKERLPTMLADRGNTSFTQNSTQKIDNNMSKLLVTNYSDEGVHNSATLAITKEEDGGQMHLSDRSNTETLTIFSDELKDAHITELKEKISGFKAKLHSSEKQASNSQRTAEIYMQETLKLSSSNNFLKAENKRLACELLETRMRERELQQLLSTSVQEVSALSEELKKAQHHKFSFLT